MSNKEYYRNYMRKVTKLTEQGRKICTYHSLSKAYRDTVVSISNISKVCKGKRNFAGGYIWRFTDDA